MTKSLFQHFKADARFYRDITHGRTRGGLPLLWSIISSPGLWMLTFHRVAYYSTCHRNHRNHRSALWWMMRVLESLGTYLNAVICTSEIAADCDIQGPIYLSNKGLYIFGALRVGAGCVIHHHVTFGMAVADGKQHRPTVGANVWIGPDCVIAGNPHIGDGATLLPGTYLTRSVPPDTVVEGNPARIIRRNFDNTELRSSLTIVTETPALQS